jgi:8-oxo-dGTP pyrophosphatase MutT (NUDIX family)
LYDASWNFLLQQRDKSKYIQNSGIYTLFGGSVEKGESLLSALQREAREELWINVCIEDISNRHLFMKYDHYNKQYTKCFI